MTTAGTSTFLPIDAETLLVVRRLEKVAFAMLAFPMLNGLLLPFTGENLLLFWIVDTIQFVIITGICWFYLFSKWKYSPAMFGLTLPSTTRETNVLLVHTAFWIAVFPWLILTLYALTLCIFPWQTYPAAFSFHSVLPDSIQARTMIAIYGSIGGGVVEEFLYRGVLVALFRRYNMSSSMIVLVVSCIFSYIHWETGLFNIPSTFVLSIFITAYYLKTNKLFPLVISHAICDMILFLQPEWSGSYMQWIWDMIYS